MVIILVVICGVCVLYVYSFMSILYGVLYSDGSMLQWKFVLFNYHFVYLKSKRFSVIRPWSSSRGHSTSASVTDTFTVQ